MALSSQNVCCVCFSTHRSSGFATTAKGGNVPGYAAGLGLIPDLELVVVALWPTMQIPELPALNYATDAIVPV